LFCGLSESWAILALRHHSSCNLDNVNTKRFGHDIWPDRPAPGTYQRWWKSCSGTEEFKWTAGEFMKSTLKGVSQVTFVENWKTGIFWVVGLTLAFELAPFITGQDRPWWTNGYTAQWNEFSTLYLGGLMALVGSAVGAGMAILPNRNWRDKRVYIFNQVLVMIALTSFLPLTAQSVLIALLATVSCGFVMPAMQRFFGMWGLPALTGPFVFTAWVFLLGISGFSNIPAGIGWSRP
jgi:urea transporter